MSPFAFSVELMRVKFPLLIISFIVQFINVTFPLFVLVPSNVLFSIIMFPVNVDMYGIISSVLFVITAPSPLSLKFGPRVVLSPSINVPLLLMVVSSVELSINNVP